MNRYETMLILDSTLDQDKINSVISRYEDIIKEDGEIIEIDPWGKKRLAYQINKKPTGFYVLYKYKAGNTIPQKLVNDLNLNASVLRHMTLVVDKKMLKQEQLDLAGHSKEEEAKTEAADKPASEENQEKN
ncbi:MAG: 30S ribosomal protein S6 [Candidatus Delongbacteria bacterium]|nr:30S ribosomal protein S6 [Candidatus Delongbacteria bacterium]